MTKQTRKEQHRELDLRIRSMIVEIHKDIMRGDWDNVESNTEHLETLCREDMILLTGNKDLVAVASWFESWSVTTEGMKDPNDESDPIVKSVLNTAQNDYPRHLSVRHTGESELSRFDWVLPKNIEERFDADADPASSRVQFAQGYPLTRAKLIQKLEEWRLEAVELGLGMCALKLMEEKEAVERLGEPEAIAFANQVVGTCLRAMAEKRSQDIMAERLNTNSTMFRKAYQMNREQYIEFLQNWRGEALKVNMFPETQILDAHINNLWGMTDEQYKAWKLTSNDAIASSIQRIAQKLARVIMGDEKFGTRAVIRNEQPTGRSKETRNIGEVEIPYTGRLKGIAKRVISPDELPTDESGAVADINVHDKPLMGSYLQSTKPEGYSNKLTTNQPAMERLTAEKEMLQVFCTILSKEMADRLARDLEHLINITDDAEYAEAISQEVRRIRLFAEGRIKTLSDVNFAWVYHDK